MSILTVELQALTFMRRPSNSNRFARLIHQFHCHDRFRYPFRRSRARWRPLNSIDRRVAGVLGEKAKTTPDTYPMSLNGIVAGCNQKSNRAPVVPARARPGGGIARPLARIRRGDPC